MANPSTYSRDFSFTDFQTSTPQDPLPGLQVDVELDTISGSIASLVGAVTDIRRSDGKLKNGVVTKDALAADFSIGFTLRGTWTLGASYAQGDGVIQGVKFYKALLANTATSANRPDLDPVNWQYLFDLVGNIPTDGSVTTAKIADGAVVTAKLGDGAVSTAKLADLAVTAAKLADLAVTLSKLADGAVSTAKIDPAGIDLSRVSFDRSVTGSRRAAMSLIVGVDTVNAREFVNCDGTDETVKLRNAYNAAKGKRLILPAGEIKVSSTPASPALTFDALAQMTIQGEGQVHANGETGSVIRDVGTGNTFFCDDGARPGNQDVSLNLRDFTIWGNSLSLNGIYFVKMTQTVLAGVAVIQCGNNGIRWERCFNSKIKNCWISANRQRGILLAIATNAVSIENCLVAANDAGSSGFANLHLDILNPGDEPNKAVLISNNDISSYSGQFGLFIANSLGVVVQANDIEGNGTAKGLTLGSSVEGLTVQGNTFVGCQCNIDGAKNSFIGPNVLWGAYTGGTLRVVASTSGDNVGVTGQVLASGATEALVGVGSGGLYKIGRT